MENDIHNLAAMLCCRFLTILNSGLLQITWTAHHASRAGDMQPAEISQESLVSYLPLSHIAAQIYDLWTGIQWGEQVSFAQPDALKVNVQEQDFC